MLNMLNVDIEKIEYSFENNLISSNLRFSLSMGDILLIKWSTWCGKTTMLKVFSWLYNNSSTINVEWSIFFGKNSILNGDCSEFIWFLFQDVEDQFLLNTVYHEIYLPLNLEQKKKADLLIDYFGVKRLIDKLLKDLSSGEKKLVALISVLALDKPILFLDEPLSNLDYNHVKKVLSYLTKIKKDKIIILSSHDNIPKEMCNKLLIKEWGKRFFLDEYKHTYGWKSTIKLTSCPCENIMFTIDNIKYNYPDRKSVSYKGKYQINKWDIVLLEWCNWSWKTTLINIISWKLAVDHNMFYKSKYSLWLILQEPEKQLFWNSVYDEITLNLSKDEIDQNYIDLLLNTIWLYEKKHEHPFFLSRWQKQVLLILSVILTNSELLIFDEPFTGMDPNLINQILEILKIHYEKTNCTIIFSDQNDLVYNIIDLKKIFINAFN